LQTDILKSILSPLFIQKILKENYNLKNIINVSLIRSNNNDIYKINTKDNQYIFKIFNLDKKFQDLEFEIEYMLYLNSNNILISFPLKTVNNKRFVHIKYPEGKKLAILTNYIEGVPLKYTSNDLYLFGKNIAKLHKVSNSFSIPIDKQKKYDIFKVFLKKRSIIENFLKKYHPQYLNYFSNFSDYLLNFKNIKFTKGYCHNDLHTDKAKKTNNGIYLFDFEFSGYGYIIYELAVFKWSSILNNKLNIWKNFIKGYKSIFTINEQEFNYIYCFVAIRDIIAMSFYIDRINIIGHKAINGKYIKNRMEFLKKLHKEIIRSKL
jgi:Ser/Thr protein kinase RdoA (MazF antagonist)